MSFSVDLNKDLFDLNKEERLDPSKFLIMDIGQIIPIAPK
jgi:hypothetical protein